MVAGSGWAPLALAVLAQPDVSRGLRTIVAEGGHDGTLFQVFGPIAEPGQARLLCGS